jgi:hypothetical protein
MADSPDPSERPTPHNHQKFDCSVTDVENNAFLGTRIRRSGRIPTRLFESPSRQDRPQGQRLARRFGFATRELGFFSFLTRTRTDPPPKLLRIPAPNFATGLPGWTKGVSYTESSRLGLGSEGNDRGALGGCMTALAA